MLKKKHPDISFVSICDLDATVDLFRNIFSNDLRDGEVRLLPDWQIPDLQEYAGYVHKPGAN